MFRMAGSELDERCGPWHRARLPLGVATALVLAGALALGFPSRAYPADAQVVESGLRFEALRHDFGRVDGGETVIHEFTFSNLDAEAVEIAGVKSSCGCLVIGAWPQRVEGGETGVIPVQFATANYSGQVGEHVTVTFAEPGRPPIRLEIAAMIWWPIEVTPRSAVFEFGRDSGSNPVATVRITNREATPLELREPVSSHRALAATLRTIRAGQEYELVIRTLPPLPAGNVFGEVRLPSSSPRMPVVVIPVSGLLQSDVVVSPSRLTVSAGATAEDRQLILAIRSFWTNALEVGSPSVSRAGVGVEVRPVKPGREYEVVVTVPAGVAFAAGEKVELRLQTNHPRYRVLRVPIAAEQSAPRQ